ncbi:hypothetical protein ATL39_0238 [Sinobaca qinghaiensis]|uniref:Uncharacterized protein n=1 Tax=Sinobaca qinghaiensis TaxID=342944 RepID=A0A419V7E4_9BACL|nr:hypothetical protein ATL39_0238 [Sinobaca qinghaiensis]
MDKTITTWVVSGAVYLTAVIILSLFLGNGSSM